MHNITTILISFICLTMITLYFYFISMLNYKISPFSIKDVEEYDYELFYKENKIYRKKILTFSIPSIIVLSILPYFIDNYFLGVGIISGSFLLLLIVNMIIYILTKKKLKNILQ